MSYGSYVPGEPFLELDDSGINFDVDDEQVGSGVDFD